MKCEALLNQPPRPASTLAAKSSDPRKPLARWLLIPALALVGCSKSVETAVTPPLPPPLSPESEAIALQRGKAIAAETFALLSANLQSAIQSGGVSNALPFCSIAASPLTAGMAAKHGVSLKRVTHKARNPAGKADATELAVLEAFASALGSGATTRPPAPFVTNLVSDQATFFAPIVLNNELCLKCHGDPAHDIAPADLALIRSLYPRDEATGFRLGQLRGAWRIDFPRTTLTSDPHPEIP
jgi:hypothetical protein